MKESLEFIYKEQRELSTYSGIAALLGWDQMTYMPKMGASERSEQSSLISRLAHEKFTSNILFDHLKKLSKEEIFRTLKENDKAVVKRLARWDWIATLIVINLAIVFGAVMLAFALAQGF